MSSRSCLSWSTALQLNILWHSDHSHRQQLVPPDKGERLLLKIARKILKQFQMLTLRNKRLFSFNLNADQLRLSTEVWLFHWGCTPLLHLVSKCPPRTDCHKSWMLVWGAVGGAWEDLPFVKSGSSKFVKWILSKLLKCGFAFLANSHFGY